MNKRKMRRIVRKAKPGDILEITLVPAGNHHDREWPMAIVIRNDFDPELFNRTVVNNGAAHTPQNKRGIAAPPLWRAKEKSTLFQSLHEGVYYRYR